ncbi:MAG TPA: cation diffusion facilitator family transporter [Stellaceae bacterium]|nr:cation diffusion facilitator family transporter [Stellaceae bacterium]
MTDALPVPAPDRAPGVPNSKMVDRTENGRGEENKALRRLATYASIANAIVLIGAKIFAWLATGSLALLTSVVDAGVDLAASAGTFVGVRYAQQPPDLEHRFGHGKAESLTAALQAVFLAGSAVVLIAEAVDHLITPQALDHLAIGLGVIAASIVVTGGLVLFQGHVVRRTRSEAISADQAHYRADIVMNIAVLAALILTKLTGWQRFDPLFALGIAGYMAWSAWRVARRATDVLLDRELPDADRQRIEEIVRRDSRARGIHDLRTRHAGDRLFIEFHLEIDGQLTIEQGHEIADSLEGAVRAAYPMAEVIVHEEPAGIADERLDDRVRRSG